MLRMPKLFKWENTPLRRKFISSFIGIIIIIIVALFFILNLSTRQSNAMDMILDEYHNTSIFMKRFVGERNILSQTITSRVSFDEKEYQIKKEESNKIIDILKTNKGQERNKRLALKHAIVNSFRVYRNNEKELIKLYNEKGNQDQEFISKYYTLQRHAEYIKQYANLLLEESVSYGAEIHYEIVDKYRFFQFLIYITGILAIAYIVFISRLLNKSFIQPIITLKDRAENIIKGNFTLKSQEIGGEDEISNLIQTFDIMEDKLQQRISILAEKAEIEKNLRYKEVENERMEKLIEQIKFAQLQSQMNPHFLFNCLNTAHSLAMIEDANITKEMINTLADFFRYTLETGKDLVTISEELEIVKTYMKIQNYRFSDRIKLNIKGEFPKNILIPKFIIQPLVENSFVHGFSLEKQGNIDVIISVGDEKNIEIMVKDNGQGFKEDKGEKQKTSIGISNIRDRLKIFDLESSVDILSEVDRGTIVRLRLKGRLL